MSELNIIELIEKNPISRLSSAYNNKLLLKIQETFTGFEQQLFVSSFYCYLNYDKNIDFVIDLDDVWKWLGFQQKYHAKVVLEKQFIIGLDYKTAPANSGATSSEEKVALPIGKAVFEQETKPKVKQNGGQNKQTILLTIKCFKSLCLKAQTKKASEIHEYYMKMEEVLHKVVEEETDELRQQLEQKENIILEKENTIIKTKKEKQRAVEQATIIQFPLNTECIYFGTIDNTNDAKENLVKFGHTNDLSTRVSDHRKKYDNFILVAAFRVQNKVEIENLIKTYPKIKRQIRSIQVGGKTKTEIIAYDSTNFTLEKLSKHIKDIIHSKTYSIDNFNKLMKQNEELENENRELKEQLKKNTETITKQTIEINEMREIIDNQKSFVQIENQSVYQNALIPEDENTQKFREFIDTMCIVRPDVEEASTSMEGQFRIWCKTKPKKETFHALKNYLDTRFKSARISNQTKDQIVHGYIGVKLKDIVYKKRLASSDNVETFLFQVCRFSPNGKMLNSTLLAEYQRWKKSVDKECSENDMKEIKDYLNSCEYVLKATVWTDNGSNEGYYGILLKSDEHKHKTTSSTGKKVQKVDISSGNVLGTWETIAKAAQYESMSASKMSLSIKNQTKFNNDYYYKTDNQC
jgi:cell division septum initiation protein DivIVA